MLAFVEPEVRQAKFTSAPLFDAIPLVHREGHALQEGLFFSGRCTLEARAAPPQGPCDYQKTSQPILFSFVFLCRRWTATSLRTTAAPSTPSSRTAAGRCSPSTPEQLRAAGPGRLRGDDRLCLRHGTALLCVLCVQACGSTQVRPQRADRWVPTSVWIEGQ